MEIINILYVIISGEKTELCLGIRDMGNFKLTQPFFSLYIEYRCMGKPYPGRKGEKKEFKFLTDKGCYNPNMTVSTDGTRTVVRQPSAEKKSGTDKKKTS